MGRELLCCPADAAAAGGGEGEDPLAVPRIALAEGVYDLRRGAIPDWKAEIDGIVAFPLFHSSTLPAISTSFFPIFSRLQRASGFVHLRSASVYGFSGTISNRDDFACSARDFAIFLVLPASALK